MIVAGFGFRRAATAGSLADALRAAQLAAGATAGALATVDRKASALAPMASRAGMGLIAVPEAELRRQVTATQSGASRGSYGTGSVAEAAALAAAGPGA
ncbi:MAG: cobalamin biosynthesis protein, partial [Pseudomonadota bacterium]